MKKKFFHLLINNISFKDVVNDIVIKAVERIPSYLCAVNVHMTVEAKKDEELKKAVNSSTWAVSDGTPIAWAYSKLLKTSQKRIAGMDLTPRLLNESNKHGLVVSVYGNTQENLDKFACYIRKYHPNVKIGSLISPPFRTLKENELDTYLSVINSTSSQLIFVSLGCPKQEKWMFKNSHKINGVCLGVGNAINTIIGQEKRPPKLMQHIGMEWFFRLVQNPKRLFRRYLYTNSEFCLMVLKEMLNYKKN